MKKAQNILVFVVLCLCVFIICNVFFSNTCHASDFIPQEVTSEVYVNQVKTTEDSYQYTNHRNFESTYCQYKDDRGYCNRNVVPRPYKLQPVTVYTGKTVTVQKHYDVYQPVVTYQKVNSYSTTQTCEYCK